MGQTTPGLNDDDVVAFNNVIITTTVPPCPSTSSSSTTSLNTQSSSVYEDDVWSIYNYTYSNFSNSLSFFLEEENSDNKFNMHNDNNENRPDHQSDQVFIAASRGGGYKLGDIAMSVISGTHRDTGIVNGSSFSLAPNGTLDGQNGVPLWEAIPLGIVLVFLCLLTTVGNVIVLHAVKTERRLQTVSNLFIVSLAVADVIVGILVMPISAFYILTNTWVLGVAVCQIWVAVDYIASTASIFNLFILSLDRYWSVRQPLQYLHKRTKKRALTFIGVVWVISALWIIPVVGWNHFAHDGRRTVASDVCDTEYSKNMPFKLVTSFLNFFLPLSVMYILYFKVFIEIRKRSQFEMGQRNAGGTTTVFSYKSNVVNHSGSMEFSDIHDLSGGVGGGGVGGNSGTGINGTSTSGSGSSGGQIQVYRRIAAPLRFRENGGARVIHRGGCKNAKLLSVKRIGSNVGSPNASGGVSVSGGNGTNGGGLGSIPPSVCSHSRDSKPSTKSSCKVEYIYDENVIDPQTEKIERYFYEEHYPLSATSSLPRITRSEDKAEKQLPSSIPSYHHLPPSFLDSNHSNTNDHLSLPPHVHHDRHNQNHLLQHQQQQKQQFHPHKSVPSASDQNSIPNYHHLNTEQNTHHHNLAVHINNSTAKPMSTAKRRFFKRHRKGLFSTTNASSATSCPSSFSSASSISQSPLTKSNSTYFCRKNFSKRKHETSFSPPMFSDIAEASSSSSASTFEEKRSIDEKDLNMLSTSPAKRKARESFSIASGIRKMRNGESLLERTTGRGITHSNSTLETGGSFPKVGVGENPEGSNSSSNSRHHRGRSSSGGVASSFILMGMRNRGKTKRGSSSSFLKKEIKAARQLGVIMGAFTLCFLPYFILYMVVSFCDNCVNEGIYKAATWVGYLNSTLNPFLYPLCNANFRIKFKKMFQCCKNQQSTFAHAQFSRHDQMDRVYGTSSRYD